MLFSKQHIYTWCCRRTQNSNIFWILRKMSWTFHAFKNFQQYWCCFYSLVNYFDYFLQHDDILLYVDILFARYLYFLFLTFAVFNSTKYLLFWRCSRVVSKIISTVTGSLLPSTHDKTELVDQQHLNFPVSESLSRITLRYTTRLYNRNESVKFFNKYQKYLLRCYH